MYSIYMCSWLDIEEVLMWSIDMPSFCRRCYSSCSMPRLKTYQLPTILQPYSRSDFMIYIQLEPAILYVENSQTYLVAIRAATQLVSYSAPTSARVAGHKQVPYIYSNGKPRSKRVSMLEGNGRMTSQLVSWAHCPKSVDRVDGHAESAVARVCSSAAADRWVPIQRQLAEKEFVSPSVLFVYSLSHLFRRAKTKYNNTSVLQLCT